MLQPAVQAPCLMCDSTGKLKIPVPQADGQVKTIEQQCPHCNGKGFLVRHGYATK